MSLPAIERFEVSGGVRVYRIPVEAFPGFIMFCYVILDAGPPTLVDTGSGYGNSDMHLLAGIDALHDDFGEPLDVTDIQRIIVTHAHIDHFGGLANMVARTGAQVGIHELDRRVINAYEERLVLATKDLRVYLERAGVSPRLRDKLIDMYGFAKQHVRSVPVDFTLDERKSLDGLQFIHVPGHCPGQVCIRIEDVLLSADHVLARITPHQAPESITHYTGLGHYIDSLYKITQVQGIRLALGGHEEPITDLYERIIAINASHQRKLQRVLDTFRALRQPATVSDISEAIYPEREGYDILLAIEEVGAHVEYLYEHGRLAIENLAEVEREDNPALRYVMA